MYPEFFIFIRHNFAIKINSKDISFIESHGHYSKMAIVNTSYIINTGLAQLEADLPADLFCRVHRAYIVQIPHIIHIDNNLIHLDNGDIPFGKQYREKLFNRLKIYR
ncbi:LytTR family DNA-binding domain-containing protein [Chitinophaga sp. CF118]|uniref:LytR/AlgR family response regulator transcription factor n=1 Tax=Chitinophaga sp. CF118 TaxID=1884367 RepID=UPI000B7F234C|nr:LytTR family DNA-binding domain-containing protein [Chitinophaga sp. CF118]